MRYLNPRDELKQAAAQRLSIASSHYASGGIGEPMTTPREKADLTVALGFGVRAG